MTLTQETGDVIIVAMKLDESGRELLAYALTNFVKAGDSVIALHVTRSTPRISADIDPKSLKLDEKEGTQGVLSDVIGDNQGICENKKVQLQVEFAVGSSLKKAIVEHAKKKGASRVVLGYACDKSHLSALHRPSFSLAKYCATKLPCTCSITVIQHGRVAFEKEGTSKSHDDEARTVLSTIQRTVRNQTKKVKDHLQVEKKAQSPRPGQLPAVLLQQLLPRNSLLAEGCETQSFPGSKRFVHTESFHERRLSQHQEGPKALQFYLKECKSTENENLEHITESIQQKDGYPLQKLEKDGISSEAGWPLLHRSVTMTKVHEDLQSHQLSVVEWALLLPNRPKEKLDRQSLLPESREEACISDETDSNLPSERMDPSWNMMSKVELLRQNNFCREFHLLELQAATGNFSSDNMIGKGKCSKVYRGILLNGNMVAVKCLRASVPDSQVEFITEVEILSNLFHSHIVQLLGYCIGSDSFYLVYNFASEGNLEQKLHADCNSKTILPWDARYKVAIGIAEALAYLHNGCTRPVIHRDVKSSNILLTSGLEPQLTDFGLAKWASASALPMTCSDVVGTFGYLAPEYFMFGKVSDKTDVFSFGVVLLELITGRRPIENECAKGKENLVVWATPLLEDERNFPQLIDPKLEGNYNDAQLKNVIIAAAQCLRQSLHSRPPMNWIIKLLNGETKDMEYPTGQDPVYKDGDDEYDIPTNYGISDIREHLTVALFGVDDDTTSHGSTDISINLSHSHKYFEEYLHGRYSRSSSFE